MNRRNLIIGLGVIAVLVVGGFLWWRQNSTATTSTTASLQTAEIERGTLVTGVNAAGTMAALQSDTLTWHTTGIVAKVNVKVGQVVDVGDVLLELDPSSYAPAILQAQLDVINAQDALDTLLVGATAQQLADAQLAVINAQDAVTTAQRNLSNVTHINVSYYQTQLQQAEQSLTTAQQNAEITNFQSNLNSAAEAVTSAANNIESIKALDVKYPGYAQQRDRLKQAEATYASAQQTYQTALYRLQQAQNNDSNTISNAQTSVNTAKANLAAAQSGPSSAKVTLYQTQLDVARANLQKAQDDLAALQAGPDEQDLAAAKIKLATAQASAEAVRVVAPFRGTVVSVANRTGDSVDANQTAITLADLSSLEIRVDVAEVDINRVQVGQVVNLTTDAAPDQTFTGQVAEVPFIGSSSQGVVTFPVKVIVPDPDPALKPGMTAAVAIVTESRADVLLVPNRAIRVTNGQRSVTVLFEGEQIPVQVTLGLSNETYTEVNSNTLREGDTVVLNTSTTTTQTSGGFFGLFGGGAVGRGPGGP